MRTQTDQTYMITALQLVIKDTERTIDLLDDPKTIATLDARITVEDRKKVIRGLHVILDNLKTQQIFYKRKG